MVDRERQQVSDRIIKRDLASTCTNLQGMWWDELGE